MFSHVCYSSSCNSELEPSIKTVHTQEEPTIMQLCGDGSVAGGSMEAG